jgi:hypothetical protein
MEVLCIVCIVIILDHSMTKHSSLILALKDYADVIRLCICPEYQQALNFLYHVYKPLIQNENKF